MPGDFIIQLAADWLVVAVVLVAGAGGLMFVPRKIWPAAIARALLAGLSALFFAKIIALIYQGERPFVELGVAPKAAYLDNPGFPSDHALLVFTITAVFWATSKKPGLSLVLLALSVFVAVGRVVALVHTPWDVLGGAFCAVAAGILVYGRQIFKKSPPTL